MESCGEVEEAGESGRAGISSCVAVKVPADHGVH
jgi:hypothetical protein